MQPAKPRKVKRSLISHGGKAGSLLPSPSYRIPELLIPTSHTPQQRESREVQGGNGFNQPCKVIGGSSTAVIGDKTSLG